MSNNQLARINEELSPFTLGETLARSGYFSDVRDAAQAVVKILAGREMGIGPIAAMTGINIIQGRVALSANLMAAQVKRSGVYNYRVIRLDNEVCELAFFEHGQEVGRSSFTLKDARQAGTKNLEKFPRNMLFARALSNGVKWFCPDIAGGSPIYTPEELGAIETPQPAPAVVEAGAEFVEVDDAREDMITEIINLGREMNRLNLWQPDEMKPRRSTMDAMSYLDLEQLRNAYAARIPASQDDEEVPLFDSSPI